MVVLSLRLWLWLVHNNILVDTGQPLRDTPSVERMELGIADLPGDAGLTRVGCSAAAQLPSRHREPGTVAIRGSLAVAKVLAACLQVRIRPSAAAASRTARADAGKARTFDTIAIRRTTTFQASSFGDSRRWLLDRPSVDWNDRSRAEGLLRASSLPASAAIRCASSSRAASPSRRAVSQRGHLWTGQPHPSAGNKGADIVACGHLATKDQRAAEATALSA